MLYSSTLEARDGTLVPVFSDGKTMFSRYAPLKEAEGFGASIPSGEAQGGFFAVGGLGNGIHVQSIRRRFPDSAILVIERSQEDIQWLKDHFGLELLLGMENLWLTSIPQAAETFTRLYNPLLHGDFFFVPVRAWMDHIPAEADGLRASLEQALALIAGDYSTQAHFGKIWLRNFFLNLQLLAESPHGFQLQDPSNYAGAFVAAAGPSLESFIPDLQDRSIRRRVYLIATDTALPALLRQGIAPDMAVTIDGQASSARHFLQALPRSMVLAADVSSSPAAVRRCRESGCPILFFRNRNPLPLLLDRYLETDHGAGVSAAHGCAGRAFLAEVDTGGGTVTSAAVDVACKMGFCQIQVGGGDFAYIRGKPYCRGTYFEDLFCGGSCRTSPSEHKYLALMYRNATARRDGKLSTAVLDEYSRSLQGYMKSHGNVRFITDSTRVCAVAAAGPPGGTARSRLEIPALTPGQLSGFIGWYKSLLEEGRQEAISSILPLLGWHVKKNSGKCDVFHIMKLAYSQTVRYTEPYGK